MAAGARGRRHQPKRVACPPDLKRMARVDGTVTAHRLAAARMIGRPLLPWEVVHHRNHDQDRFVIGRRNYVILKKLLWKNNLLIDGEQVGGDVARTMYLDVGNGNIWVTVAGEVSPL